MAGGFAIGIGGRLCIATGGGFRSLWLAGLRWNMHEIRDDEWCDAMEDMVEDYH